MRTVFIKHCVLAFRVGVWRNLAKVHIGDPLNVLVTVNKYKPYREDK